MEDKKDSVDENYEKIDKQIQERILKWIKNHSDDTELKWTDQQKEIFKILLTPIEATRAKNGKRIERTGNEIISPQHYRSKFLDPDMSDLAVKFYKILYTNSLQSFLPENGEILDNEGHFVDMDFAGDTMNSFHSIANRTDKAGTSRKGRTSIIEWPEYLKIYFRQYHCLANFWIIPMALGRSSSKGERGSNHFDSPHIFLNRIEEGEQTFKRFESYGAMLEKNKLNNEGIRSEFQRIHYLDDSYGKNGLSTKELEKLYLSGSGNTVELIDFITISIYKRAEKIVSDEELCKQLYDLFKDLKLVD